MSEAVDDNAPIGEGSDLGPEAPSSEEWVTGIIAEENLGSPETSGEEGDEESSAEPAPEVDETPPAQEPEPEPEPQPSAEAAPEPQDQEPEPQPTETPLTEAERAAQILEWQQSLAANYQMSEEDANNLLTEPNKVLPALAARLYTDIYQEVTRNIFAQLAESLPNFVRNQIEAHKVSQTNEERFYEKWPELRRYADIVRQVSELHQQTRKGVDFDTFIREVGMQAWMAAGLPQAQLLDRLADKPAEPEEEVRSSPAPGAQPAPGPTSAPPSAPKDVNVFTQLAEEIQREGI